MDGRLIETGLFSRNCVPFLIGFFDGRLMQPLKWAVATRCWKTPLPETLRRIAELNVTGLQLDLRTELPPDALSASGQRDFLHRLREHGLSVASGWVPLRHPLYSPIELERRVAFLRDAMSFAWQLQTTTLCLRIGRIPESLDAGEGKTLVEVLSDLAAHGNHVGVTLAITPTADTAAQLEQLLSQIKTGPLGIDFDPAHFAMTAQPVGEALRTLHRSIVHVQLRDGLRDLAGGGAETPLGEGTVDWPELIALLGEIDYRGWLTASREQGDDRAGDITRGLSRLRHLVPGL